MELVKREDHWALYNEDGHKIAATIPGCNSKLSIKNCEAITNGYDLDELYEKVVNSDFSDKYEDGVHYYSFIEGFQKALEILGDKKFSELDMRIAYDAGCNNIDADGGPIDDYNIDFQDTINLLQQTEWDVQVEQELIQSSIEGEAIWKTKLDADNCLILKRI